ncbi:MAG TPA: methyltransferase [Kiloniellaceae bacterium]|nr:methyltransferase [Kiloniellaceae bacterium]
MAAKGGPEPAGAAHDSDGVRQLVTGYQAARALLAADEIGLLDHLDGTPQSVAALAAATETHEPSLARFLRALAAVGLVTLKADGRVDRGPLADGLRDAARIGVENYRAWCELPYSLRSGKPAFDRVFGMGFYRYLDSAPERAARFNEALAAVSRGWIDGVLAALDFDDDTVVADVGGGHGSFIAALLRRHPELHGILIDRPAVLARAEAVLTAAEVADRCRLVAMNFLEAVPAGISTATLCNLLTDWDDARATAILKNCRAALDKDGRLLVVDRVLPPPDDPGHRAAAFLDLFFLVLEGGCIRSRAEFETLFETAGFRLLRSVPVGGGFHALEGR